MDCRRAKLVLEVTEDMMNDGIIIGAVIAVVLAFCLLGILIYKVGNHLASAVSMAAVSVGQSRHDFVKFSEGLRKSAEYFAQVRNIRCTKCGGSGTVEKENPLLHAIAESLEANAHAARRRK
jgi:hypothetical protein